MEEYEKIHARIVESFKKDQTSVIKNPYYHINIANNIILNESYWDDKIDCANRQLKEAINKDEESCAGAYMSKSWLLLKGKKRHLRKNSR